MTIQETLAEIKKTVAVMRHLSAIRQPISEPVPTLLDYKIPSHGGRTAKYPWKTLKLEHSFLVPCPNSPQARQRVMYSLTSCIANARKKTGRNFSQAVDPKGVRVWRTA